MLVFISWSGKQSGIVAEGLAGWLQRVIQAVDPWTSKDIPKGARWTPAIAEKLEHSRVGIVCLTPGNTESRWLHFEGGALAKTRDSYLCTLLLGIEPTEVLAPFADFQATRATREDLLNLVLTINRCVEERGEKALPDDVLREVFDTNWPSLDRLFAKARNLPAESPVRLRSERELLTEAIDLLRSQGTTLSQLAQGPSDWAHWPQSDPGPPTLDEALIGRRDLQRLVKRLGLDKEPPSLMTFVALLNQWPDEPASRAPVVVEHHKSQAGKRRNTSARVPSND